MGSVDLGWTEVATKIMLVVIFAVYCVTQLFVDHAELDLKIWSLKTIGRDIDIAVTGGSNVLFGISAKEVPDELGSFVNLGLPSEGGDEIEYYRWLKLTGFTTRLVVDSPMTFWNPSEIGHRKRKGSRVYQLMPRMSLLSFLRQLMVPQVVTESNAYVKDAHGDLVRHVCTDKFVPLKTSIAILKRTAASSGYFAQRLEAIRAATSAERVAFRVPPIWVPEQTKRHIEPMLQQVLAEFRAKGILVLDQQVLLVTDKSLFCDAAHHPNASGRTLVTTDLIQALLAAD